MKYAFLLGLLLINISSSAQVNVQIQPDGKKYAKVLLNGAVSAKYDLVFIGDGFKLADQPIFNAKVDEAVKMLSTSQPYSNQICSFNIWRVNVVSKESGISDPNKSIVRNSELGCHFGDPKKGELDRCIFTDLTAKCYAAGNLAPGIDALFILVNDRGWGGCESGLVFSTIAPDFATIVIHELGHKVANLADEYSYYDVHDPPTAYHGPIPTEANLTIETDRKKIKWNGQISATQIPTEDDNPLGVIGLFQGGKYCTSGIYRPQFNCLMRNTFAPFCGVCRTAMIKKLQLYCVNQH